MPLLEIIRTNKTSPQVLLDVIDLAKIIGKKIHGNFENIDFSQGKTPIVVGNCIGFTVNRMFYPYSQAALFLGTTEIPLTI